MPKILNTDEANRPQIQPEPGTPEYKSALIAANTQHSHDLAYKKAEYLDSWDYSQLVKEEAKQRRNHFRDVMIPQYTGQAMRGRSLDKLAQLRKTRTKGAVIYERARLQKRAGKKYLTNSLIYQLLRVKSPLHNSYARSLNCTKELVQDGTNELQATYCNNRWCLVCNNIRTGKLINGYEDSLADLKDKQFVTLTRPNVPGFLLRQTMTDMVKDFCRIKDTMRKRGVPIHGIRKLECTHSDKRRDFHPHFHCIIEGEAAAQMFMDLWLKKNPQAKRVGQDIKPADPGSIKELFKYFTKIFSRDDDGNFKRTDIRALDVMFQAMQGRRVFQNMGRVAKVSEDVEEITIQAYTDLEHGVCSWSYEQSAADWVNRETGELLTQYKLPEAHAKINQYLIFDERANDPPDL